MVELRVPAGEEPTAALAVARTLSAAGFDLDAGYDPVPMSPPAGAAAADEATVIVRGTVASERIAELEAHRRVARVWRDTRIEPFG
jgi:hypothetical protein